MNELPVKLDGIADIVSPIATPQDDTTIWVTASISVMVLVSIVLLLAWKHIRSPRYRALRKLDALHTSLWQQAPADKSVAFRIADILRYGLGKTRISTTTRLPEHFTKELEQWQDFVMALQQARYSPEACDTNILVRLITESRYWLRHW